MKKAFKITAFFMTVILAVCAVCPSVFARDFAPVVDITNPGIQTQYAYEENDPSWLRKLTIKEDMLSTSGLFTEAVLYPVCSYPYTTDALNFKKEVAEYVELYTLDEDSQKAAYLYLLEQIGALNVITEPETDDKTRADWLRSHGIVVTNEDENSAEGLLMIMALYSMMKNDLYYVYTGEQLVIPDGTPLEEAIVVYIVALSGQQTSLGQFILKYFGTSSFGDLEDYIYYTSLMSLYVSGYISANEIVTISRDEVYRRVAIMTIRNAGIAIDADSATAEEIRQKYLTAMLGAQYKVTLDSTALNKANKNKNIPFYILQRMAYEDVKAQLSQNKYSYEQIFDYVLKKTNRFNLKNEFYSDIYQYNLYLEAAREEISINPTPISKSYTVTINDTQARGNAYEVIPLSDSGVQTITIISNYSDAGVSKTSRYIINVYQGQKAPADSDITGIVPTVGEDIFTDSSTKSDSSENGQLQATLPDGVADINSNAAGLVSGILHLNDKGQLIDQNGNVVNNAYYEDLPEGYKYVLDDFGVISVVPMDGSEDETASGQLGNLSKEKLTKIIIVASAVCLMLLIICAVTFAVLNKKGIIGKSEVEKMKKRKEKERAKRQKKENKAK